MPFPPDVTRWLADTFAPADLAEATALLESAVDERGEPVGDRLLRCAAWSARGSLDRLRVIRRDLAIDWRDVIVEAEYDVVDRTLVRARNFADPMPE
ncbi:MAG: hypothetical protein HZB16_03270 [Armatimonadetes bacterium]|nr:hypothetical protein [Armatimonadota bacterium]